MIRRKVCRLANELDKSITENSKFSEKLITSPPNHQETNWTSYHPDNTSDAAIIEIIIFFWFTDHVLPGIGEEFPAITEFHVRGYSIKFIERRDFASMSQLTQLNLYGLSIDFLPDDLLADLPNLETIDITHCKIDQIPEKLFENQRELVKLYLGTNSISVLKKDLFKFNLKLELVKLERNNLLQIFVDFTKMPAIHAVDLRNNDCLNQYFLKGWSSSESLQSLQSAVKSCCGAHPPSRLPYKLNCKCFPGAETCYL